MLFLAAAHILSSFWEAREEGGAWDSSVGELNPSETGYPEFMAEIGFSLCKSMVGSRWKILVALRRTSGRERGCVRKWWRGEGNLLLLLGASSGAVRWYNLADLLA